MGLEQRWPEENEVKSEDGESNTVEAVQEKYDDAHDLTVVDEVVDDEAGITSESDVSAKPPGPPPPPNGGYGWVCTVAFATINGHTWGLNASYGVFLAYYLSHDTFPGATRLDYAFVGGLSISTAMLISPLATFSTRKLGTHPTMFIGVFLTTASFIAASFASKIWHLCLSQGVCFGVGMGMLFIAAIPVPSQWFTTKRSLANGIAASGAGFGGLTYSLAAGAMLRNLGLPWTFRILGIICFVVNSISAALLRDRNKIIGSTHRAFDIGILRRPEYILLGGWGVFSMLGYVVLIFSLASYAESIGLNSSQASIISALFNLGQALGRPPVGYFSDNVGRINMATAMTFLCGVFALLIWNFANSFGVLIFYAIVAGSTAGTFWTCVAPIMAEVIGLRHVASGLSIIWLLITLPTAFSEPIALEIVSGTGSYLGTINFAGFMYIAAAGCILLVRGWKIGEIEHLQRKQDATTAQKDGTLIRVLTEEDSAAAKAGRKAILRYFWKPAKV